jgi:MFS family permease
MQTEAAVKNKSLPLARLYVPFAESLPFRYLWLAQLVSVLGSSVTTVILPMVVYSTTGSATTMGLTMALYMLPNVLMLPVSGWIVDRYDRVRLMAVSDLVRFVIMAVLAALVLSGRLTIPLLYGLVVVYGLMDGLFQPAYAAVRAVVFTPPIRNAANALSQLGNQIVRLLGPSLGGLIALTSTGVGFSLDALTYLVSFFFLLLLRRAAPLRNSRSGTPVRIREDFREGIDVLRSHPWLWITILAFSFINICYSGLVVVLIPWLFKIHLQLNSFAYGAAVTCSGIGAIAAALIFGSRPRWRKRGLLAYGGAGLSGLALLAMSFADTPILLGMLMALEGFGLMAFGLIWETSLQELVPEEAFGRVASLDMMGSFMLLPAGYLLVGWLADRIGGLSTIALFSSLGLAAVILLLLVPSIRRFD